MYLYAVYVYVEYIYIKKRNPSGTNRPLKNMVTFFHFVIWNSLCWYTFIYPLDLHLKCHTKLIIIC